MASITACVLQATVYGDMMGLTASLMFVLYLLIGRSLRSWMPIFAYVMPVNVMAAISLCTFAIVLEDASFDASIHGIFGQFGKLHYFVPCFYLGAVPGILGHVSFNALLRWLHPLIIALPGKPLFAHQPSFLYKCRQDNTIKLGKLISFRMHAREAFGHQNLWREI